MSNTAAKDRIMLPVIAVLSVLIPVVVAVLIFLPENTRVLDADVTFLPHLNAVLNSATAVALIIGLYCIKVQKNRKYHQTAMFTAFGLSSLFLISYVIFHYSMGSVKYGGEGMIRTFYFFVLISHILLSVAIVPLVLLSIFYAVTKRYEKHKKLVKWTFPIWLYVAISGVAVYFMIRPYYDFL